MGLITQRRAGHNPEKGIKIEMDRPKVFEESNHR
jgi:hypothetical protein